MFVQSLHFCTVAIAPPLGQSVQYFLAVNHESASTASKKCNKKFHATVTSPSWWGGDDIIVCVPGVRTNPFYFNPPWDLVSEKFVFRAPDFFFHEETTVFPNGQNLSVPYFVWEPGVGTGVGTLTS